MFKATWQWYYGSSDEEILSDCKFGQPFAVKKISDSRKLTIRPGTFANGDSINIFTLVRHQGGELSSLENCAKCLKVLRHPNILRYIGSVPVESEIHLVTEHAHPLECILNYIDAHEICSGLHDIALALQFIHEKASIAHNNVCKESIFASNNGPWKLARFEYACPFTEATQSFLKSIPNYVMPPEEKNPVGITLPLKAQYGHCRDVYGFGLLLQEFSDQIVFSTQQTKSNFQRIIEDIIREDYENRPQIREILSMSIFKSNYISIIHFLQSVTLKSTEEKVTFFKSLISNIEANNIFAEVVGRRIVPLLLTPIVIAEQSAVEHVINTILNPAIESSTSPVKEGLLPESVFARYVIPKIVELFHSRVLHVRLVLIEKFPKYVHLFESSVLKDIVLPEVLLGLNDCNNQLVRGSLHALAEAVNVVGADVIVGTEREKLFTHSIPKFDGRALNETRAIAYETKIPKRKKVQKKELKLAKPRKSTLLELAMMNKEKQPTKFDSAITVIQKQKRLANSLQAQSLVQQNGSVIVNDTEPVDLNHFVDPVPDVQKIKIKPVVETWATSDEDDQAYDKDWSDFGDEFCRSPTDVVQTSSLLEPLSQNAESADLKAKEILNISSHSGNKTLDNNAHLIEKQNTEKDSKLGAEFEVVVANCKSNVEETELDFFADMAPEIKLPANILKGNADTHSGRIALSEMSVESEQSSTISSSFAAIEDNDEEDGWDNDWE
ncbi:unnamed protein product [Clavelina lepadiformis]